MSSWTSYCRDSSLIDKLALIDSGGKEWVCDLSEKFAGIMVFLVDDFQDCCRG